ncbi:hypothetical protein AtEden1_Chr5g0111861 [Arabidopsis thaliana]
MMEEPEAEAEELQWGRWVATEEQVAAVVDATSFKDSLPNLLTSHCGENQKLHKKLVCCWFSIKYVRDRECVFRFSL